MARRRPAPDEEVPAVEVPDVLAGRCFVEDWCDPLLDTLEPYVGSEAGDVGFWAVRAWCKQRRARDEWLRDHGIPLEERCSYLPGGGGPRFRDRAAFAALLRARFPT